MSPPEAKAVAAKMPDPKQNSVRLQELAFRAVTCFFAFMVLALLLCIIASLVYGSLPAIDKFGWRFLVSAEWNPVTENFGALVPIVGTLLTSAIALAIGVPVSFGIALFLTELSPGWLKRPLGTAIELLGRDPEHHLRHVGPVRSGAAVRRLSAALVDTDAGRLAADRTAVQGSAAGDRRADRRFRSRDHGNSLHRRGDARRVRDRAAGAEGVRLRPGLHDLGSGSATSSCPTPRSA